MKLSVSIVALATAFAFSSYGFAQGGSVGKTRMVVRNYTVARVETATEFVPRLRRVWVPRAIPAQFGGSTGRTSFVAPTGGSTGRASFAANQTPVAYSVSNVSAGLDLQVEVSSSIQQHSLRQATANRMFHSRGPWGLGIRFEGVGFSTRSAQSALENCCYYGQKPLVEQSVVRGQNGWYATARFQ